jgi:hypothetical protein
LYERDHARHVIKDLFELWVNHLDCEGIIVLLLTDGANFFQDGCAVFETSHRIVVTPGIFITL